MNKYSSKKKATNLVRAKLGKKTKAKKHKFNGNNHGLTALDATGRATGNNK